MCREEDMQALQLGNQYHEFVLPFSIHALGVYRGLRKKNQIQTMKDLEFHGWSAESNNPDKQNMPTSIISGEEFSGGMEEDEEWYPGKMIGWREGEWFPGKLLGRTKDKSIRDDLQCPAYPLLWESTDQLTSTLST